MLTGSVYNSELYLAVMAFGSLCLFLVHTTGDDGYAASFCAATSFACAIAGLGAVTALFMGWIEFVEITPADTSGRVAVNVL